MTLLLFIAAIILGTLSPICMKAVITHGVTYSSLMYWRSLIIILLITPIILCGRKEWEPLTRSTAITRMLLGGLVLGLGTYAYGSLTATEVNWIGRMDLPLFLIMFGHGSKRALAALIVCLGVAYTYFPIMDGHINGIAAVWMGTILTAISYRLIRIAAVDNSIFSLVFPPYFGALVLSLVLIPAIPALPNTVALIYLLGTAAATASLYVVCAHLFRLARIGTAEFTGACALFCTYFVERMTLEEAPPAIVGYSAGIAVIMGAIMLYWEELTSWTKRRVCRL